MQPARYCRGLLLQENTDEQRGRSPAAREEQDTGCKGWKKPAVLRDPCGIHTGGTEESPGEQRLETTNWGGCTLEGKNCPAVREPVEEATAGPEGGF